ncbi:hypothetical protein Dsin_015116 [Dipteronia sinensis]|uniref:DUF4283 domain-containing protein n=1 Tax=Dipteronia sinensis TaxID=43782 RepID=A0AAE0AN85_9ROSI|nr:hypothetical protein Dsin_015116 [Dipteronia sinensis]
MTSSLVVVASSQAVAASSSAVAASSPAVAASSPAVAHLRWSITHLCVHERDGGLLVVVGFFKSFGNVRDVFLSSKNSSRKSRFAFIRFESMVKPIGWRMRRMGEDDGLGVGNKRGRSQEVRCFNNNSRSFVEVVNGLENGIQEHGFEVKKKTLFMSWDSNIYDDNWLNKCAMGVLKKFANVSSVNHRLSLRGFSFSSVYLGDKSIVWCFDSNDDREAFVSNKFFWEDCFSYMLKWCNSLIPQARLVWLDCRGVPLNVWCHSIFMKLRWMFGEPLLVDEDCVHRRRLDRGRVLVLIPHDQSYSNRIKVMVGTFSFEVRVEEDPAVVDMSWLADFLGLRMSTASNSNSNSKSLLEKGNFDAALEVGFQIGQLKNEDKKALDGLVELLRSDEAETHDEEARKQEVGEVVLMESMERDGGRRQIMGEKRDQHIGESSKKDKVKLSKGCGV